jgi:hypothetical protein
MRHRPNPRRTPGPFVPGTRASGGRFHVRVVTAFLLAGLFTVLLGPGMPGTAAAEAYRFWGFYQWTDGAWTLSNKGPAAVTPKDGTVEGWRLAVSGENTAPRVPRADGDFDQICGGTDAESGRKRVAVVLDYGLAEEEPSGTKPPEARGACAVVATGASSAQVLAAVGEVREEKSLICAIDSFPPTGCGDTVDEDPTVESPEPAVSLVLPAAETPAETPDDSTEEPAAAQNDGGSAGGFPVWPVVGAAVVLALVAGAVMIRRGRSTGGDG